MSYAPIVIFAFNRPEMLERLDRSLRANPEAAASDVYVYIDGPRKTREGEAEKVERCREIAQSMQGYKSVTVHASEKNKGLAPSVIAGVTEVIRSHGRAIVLEDDLVLLPGFLRYMNAGLDLYANDQRIISICGYGMKIKRPRGYEGDVYLHVRALSWGWATWLDRWEAIDWEVKDYAEFSADSRRRRDFNRGGSNMSGMLDSQMQGHISSWAVRFCYAQYKAGMYSVHPFKSMVYNEGFGPNATHCRQKYSRYKVDPDDGAEVHFPAVIEPNEKIIRQVRNYDSIPIRIYSRIRKMLNI